MRAILDRIFKIIVEHGRAAEQAYLACAPPRSGTAASADANRPQPAIPAGNADFVVVSALAEGADRLVAEAGLTAGFTLEAVLPFDRAEYSRDFESQDSRTAYEELLNRASAVFELAGKREESARAYEAAGFIMLANTDLLIVVWDGNEASGIGGTAEIIVRAVADGVPVVWIEPTSPNALRLSWFPGGDLPSANAYAQPTEAFRSADETELTAVIGQLLAVPTESEALKSLQQYLHSKERRWNFCPWYPLLLWLFAGHPLARSDFHLPPALLDTRERWRDYLDILPRDRSQRPAIENILLPAYAIADHLADYYAVIYRSTYVFNFISTAIAVAIALNGILIQAPARKGGAVVAELAVIVVILGSWLYGRRRQWRRHWLEYRRLAECLRHLRILAPLGTTGPIARPRRNGDVEEEDWISWYVWSLRRLLPLPDCVVDAEYLQTVRDIVRNVEIAGQIRYHTTNAERTSRLDLRIRLGAQILFAATAAFCVGFVFLVWSNALSGCAPFGRDFVLSIFSFFAALLPTLGAALAGINAQGGFRILANQSRRTVKRLIAIERTLGDEQPTFALLIDRIETTSDVMMSDLLEWHTIFRTRPLALPA